MQVAEICKIILGRGELLRNRKLSIDLLDMEMHEMAYEADYRSESGALSLLAILQVRSHRFPKTKS